MNRRAFIAADQLGPFYSQPEFAPPMFHGCPIVMEAGNSNMAPLRKLMRAGRENELINAIHEAMCLSGITRFDQIAIIVGESRIRLAAIQEAVEIEP